MLSTIYIKTVFWIQNTISSFFSTILLTNYYFSVTIIYIKALKESQLSTIANREPVMLEPGSKGRKISLWSCFGEQSAENV